MLSTNSSQLLTQARDAIARAIEYPESPYGWRKVAQIAQAAVKVAEYEQAKYRLEGLLDETN